MKEWLGDFLEPVWYNPNGVVNILSLFIVKKHYRVQYDSVKQDALIVTKPNSDKLTFTPTGRGLYALQGDVDGWVHVSTVANRVGVHQVGVS